MKLQDWMAENRVSDAEMARRCGCSAMQIGRIRRGLHMPRLGLLDAIERETSNTVNYQDLISQQRRRAA